eukprot:556845-Pelagomonas_calceolata.AAC.5
MRSGLATPQRTITVLCCWDIFRSFGKTKQRSRPCLLHCSGLGTGHSLPCGRPPARASHAARLSRSKACTWCCSSAGALNGETQNECKTHTNGCKTHTNGCKAHTNGCKAHTNGCKTHTTECKTHTNGCKTHTNGTLTDECVWRIALMHPCMDD